MIHTPGAPTPKSVLNLRHCPVVPSGLSSARDGLAAMGGQWPVVNVSKRILCAAAFEISVSAGTDEAQRRTRLVDPSDGMAAGRRDERQVRVGRERRADSQRAVYCYRVKRLREHGAYSFLRRNEQPG